MTTLDVQGLTVDYGEFRLGPLDLTVDDGITAVLGPNGSGKTTLFRAVNGLVPQATGRALVGDADLVRRDREALARCAYVPDGEDLLFPELTLEEYWAFHADLRHRFFGDDPVRMLRRAHTLRERLGLEPGRRRLREFSLGMRRKAQIITGLMVEPDVLMVDEPQNGLDFVSAHELRAILLEVRDAGTLVLMSNHDLDSVARIADRVLVLRSGALVGRSSERFASSDDCERFVAEFFCHA